MRYDVEGKIVLAKVISGNVSSSLTSDYEKLQNKPSINGVTLSGNKTSKELGIKQDYTAEDIKFTDGQTFQQKYDSGELRGQQGEPGQDGYTPQKGIDYWTDSDKQEIIQEVISELPVYNGEEETID